jgi:hypothetical protein
MLLPIILAAVNVVTLESFEMLLCARRICVSIVLCESGLNRINISQRRGAIMYCGRFYLLEW